MVQIKWCINYIRKVSVNVCIGPVKMWESTHVWEEEKLSICRCHQRGPWIWSRPAALHLEIALKYKHRKNVQGVLIVLKSYSWQKKRKQTNKTLCPFAATDFFSPLSEWKFILFISVYLWSICIRCHFSFYHFR